MCGEREAPGHISNGPVSSGLDRSVDHVGILQGPVFPHTQNSGFVPDLIAGACIGGDITEGDVETGSGGTSGGIGTHTRENHRGGATTEGNDVVGVGGALFNAALQGSGESEFRCSDGPIRHLVGGVDHSLAGGADNEDGIVLGCKSGGQAAIEGINNDPWKVLNQTFTYLR
jgi:hypothetical protein